MDEIKTIYSSINKSKRWSKLIVFSAIYFLITILVNSLLKTIGGSDVLNNPIEKMDNSVKTMLIGVVFGPIIETLIFQYGIIELTLKYITRNFWMLIIISASIFAVNHPYNIYYIIATWISGFCFAFIYINFRQINGKKMAFLAVTFVHVINNLISFIDDFM